MTFNSALADEIIGIITADPKRHDNSDWLTVPVYGRVTPMEARANCGTTACVAGWAAILTLPDGWRLANETLYDPDDWKTSYHEVGRAALGITVSQAEWLFHGARTQEEVLWALKWLRDHPDADRTALREGYRESVSGDR